jgi:hypothetical protein
MITEAEISPYYDFYLTRDNPFSGIIPNDYSGLAMNKEIAKVLKESYSDHQTGTNDYATIDKLILTEDPKSAFAYCYNKNKRNSDGSVNADDIKWFLPAIDEIEEIASGAYDEFDEVFQAEEYWSCQPAFTMNTISVNINVVWVISGSTTGDYYEDDVNRARATKIEYNESTRQYDNIPSGVDGTTNKLEIKNKGTFSTDLVYSEPKPTGEKINHHEGNNSRTEDKCRIRAVYRSGTK